MTCFGSVLALSVGLLTVWLVESGRHRFNGSSFVLSNSLIIRQDCYMFFLDDLMSHSFPLGCGSKPNRAKNWYVDSWTVGFRMWFHSLQRSMSMRDKNHNCTTEIQTRPIQIIHGNECFSVIH